MADLPTTLSFKAPTWMADWLRAEARAERRPVGSLIRLLLERVHSTATHATTTTTAPKEPRP